MARHINSNLYNMAKLAKERLKSNNYSRVENYNTLDNKKIFEDYISKQNKTVSCNIKTIIIRNESEDELYKKVCEILTSKQPIVNPINMLINRAIFNSLSAEEKQQYITKLNQKYKALKDRFYRERLSKNILIR